MIILDMTIAIAAFFSVCFVFVFGSWLFYNYRDHGWADAEAGLPIQCPYCTHVFLNSSQALLRCPLCKSIIDQAEAPLASRDGK